MNLTLIEALKFSYFELCQKWKIDGNYANRQLAEDIFAYLEQIDPELIKDLIDN